MLECIKALVIPLQHHSLGRVFQAGHMQLDRFTLANPVQPANTLFQQVRIQGQVKQHQVMRELEVAAFTADF